MNTDNGTTGRELYKLITPPAGPLVVTLPATSLTSTTVSLRGTINARGASTVVSFEYGLTTSYGSTVTATPTPITGTAGTSVAGSLTGLLPGTTYHYRTKGVNTNGTNTGTDVSFTTVASSVATLSGISLSTGTLSPAFASATTNYAVSVPNSVSSLSVTPTSTIASVTISVNGSSVGTGVASNPISLNVGVNPILIVVTAQDGTIKTYTVTATRLAPTPPTVPSATTLTAVQGIAPNVLINGTVDPKNGSTTVSFEYGPTSGYGSTVGAVQSPLTGLGAQPVSADVSGLPSHKLYHYRVTAMNSAGSANGADKTFTTNALPVAGADSAVVLPGGVVTLNALANDTDVDNDTLKLSSIKTAPSASAGTAKIVGNTIIFSAAASFASTSFTYAVADGFGGSAIGAVNITLGNCALSPALVSVPAAATTYPVTVTATGAWSATEALTWASITPSSGSGNGTVNVTLLTNTSKASRSGSLLIGGQTHTIIQAGTLGFTIDPPSSVPTGMVSADYSLTIPSLVTGVKFTMSGYPAGLSIGATTGVISGKPNVAGTFKVSVTGTTTAGASTTLVVPITIQPLPVGTAGNYTAWMSRRGRLNAGLGGYLTLSVSSTGDFTSTLKFGTATYSPKGRLLASLSGHPVVSMTVARPSPATPLTLTLDFDSTTNSVSGELSDPLDVGYQGSLISGKRTIFSGTSAAAYAASYNSAVDLPAASLNDFTQPLGVGWQQMTVTAAGAASGTGRTADGIAYSFSGPLWPDGSVPQFVLIYSGKGSVMGLPRIAAGATIPDNRVTGWVDQSKSGPASTSDHTYSAGIPYLERTIDGAPWVKPTTAFPIVLGLSDVAGNASIAFTKGDVESAAQFGSLAQTFRINTNNSTTFAAATLAAGNPCKVAMSITPTTGLFSGSFTLTDTVASKAVLRTVNYYGLFLSHRSKGYGYFLLPGLTPTTTTSPILGGRVVVN